MTKYYSILLVLLLGLTYSCAHHNDVEPKSDGVHSVTITDEDPKNQRRQAIKQANYYCQQKSKAAIFSEQETETLTSHQDAGSHMVKKVLGKNQYSRDFYCK